MQPPQRLNVTDQVVRRYDRQIDVRLTRQRTTTPAAPLVKRASRCTGRDRSKCATTAAHPNRGRHGVPPPAFHAGSRHAPTRPGDRYQPQGLRSRRARRPDTAPGHYGRSWSAPQQPEPGSRLRHIGMTGSLTDHHGSQPGARHHPRQTRSCAGSGGGHPMRRAAPVGRDLPRPSQTSTHYLPPGRRPPPRGIALGNLGLLLHQAGRFDEAITAYQDAAVFRQTATHTMSASRGGDNPGRSQDRATGLRLTAASTANLTQRLVQQDAQPPWSAMVRADGVFIIYGPPYAVGDRRLRSPTSSGNTRSGERADGRDQAAGVVREPGFRTMAPCPADLRRCWPRRGHWQGHDRCASLERGRGRGIAAAGMRWVS